MIFLGVLLAPPARAEMLPPEVESILENGADATQVAGWSLEDVLDWLGGLAAQSLGGPLRFAAQAMLYLLLAAAVRVVAMGAGWKRCVDAVAVLGYGALCLSSMMELVALVGQTARESQSYLAVFVPAYSGVAALGGQTAGAGVYSGMFFAMSAFLSAAIEQVLLPIMRIYFCFSVSAALWGNPGVEQAADLFGRCLSWGLKGCGGVFSVVLGFQNVLAGTTDSAALKMGRSLLSGAVPLVGDAAAAALTGATSALRLLKGSLALAAAAALAVSFLPVFLRCLLYYLAFSGAGIVANGSGQNQCGQICKLFANGAQLCASILTLYFFMIFLSTLLLLVTGNGG